MDIVEAARGFLGVKFRHQGRNRKGLDCGGLVYLACKKIGYPVTDIVGYSRQPDGKVLMQVLEANLLKVTRPPEYGDIVVFKLRKFPQHIGIITDIGIIHAEYDAGKVVEHNLDPSWRNKIVGVFKLG